MSNREAIELIRADGISKSYLGAAVLKNVSLSVHTGEFVLITGPSGSGKTTILNALSGLDRPDSGSISVRGKDIVSMTDREREAYRADNGMIFQRSGLMDVMTVRNNIRSGHNLTEHSIDEEWLDYVVSELAISGLMNKKANQVSGGQAQRIAIARALAHNPELIFADEPTAALDSEATADVHRVLRNVVDQGTASVVMVSHDESAKDYADNIFEIRDGENVGFPSKEQHNPNLYREAV